METREERINRLKSLRFDNGMSYQEIGDIEGVTRERVRQLIGNTGKDFLINFSKTKIIPNININSDMTREDIEKMEIRYKSVLIDKLSKIFHKAKSGNSLIGYETELKVSKKLLSLGIVNKLNSFKHPFDIELSNGKRVEVKACGKKWFSAGSKQGTYKFRVNKKERGNYFDFLICYIIEHEQYFVIPSKAIDSNNETIYIPYPSTKRNWSKWIKYHNRFDLLKS